MILEIFTKYKEKFYNSSIYLKYNKDILNKIQPIVQKWRGLSQREKNMINILTITFLVYIVVNICFSIINFSQNIEIKNANLYKMLNKVNYLQKEYDNISAFNPNKFSEISITKVKDDMTQVLDIKEPNVVLEDNLLIIKGERVPFERIIQLLGQFRNTYGIFPTKLMIIKVEPNIINFDISFMVK
jgi:hypothetical protein